MPEIELWTIVSSFSFFLLSFDSVFIAPNGAHLDFWEATLLNSFYAAFEGACFASESPLRNVGKMGKRELGFEVV